MKIEYEDLNDEVIYSRRTLPTGILHWHNSVELCQLISGHACFTVGNSPYTFEPGDIITVQSRELHLLEATEDNLVNISMIPLRELTFWMKSLPMLPPHITYKQIRTVQGLEEQIASIFDQMHTEYTIRDYYYSERLILLALSLWCLLARNFRTNTVIASKHRKLLQPVLDQIAQDCSQDFSLSSLSSQLNYTPEYLSLVFRECVGMGFKEYLDSQRINEAKRLMLTSSSSILEIAQKCGYENIRTFNNRFKALAQMTPSEFIHHYCRMPHTIFF